MYELTFSSRKEKDKSKGNGMFPVRSPRLPLSDRGQQLRELRKRTECYACGRQGHWAHDYECAIFPFSLFPNSQTRTARMTTRQHHSNQSRKVTTCCFLDDCDDDHETFANIVDGEGTDQTDISDTDSFQCCRHLSGKIFLTSTPQTTTGHGRAKMNANRTRTQDSRMERTAVCCAETFFTRLSETSCVINKGRERTDKHA